MSDPKFKANDPLNPYDPASFSLGTEGVGARLNAGTAPTQVLSQINKNPKMMEGFLKMMKEDIADAKRRGETMEERMMREKREWAEADAESAKIKENGNDAFRKGDFEDAFVAYSACIEISEHEPLYPLNRSAAALKLKLFKTVVLDATFCLEHDYNQAKAYFRRGQAPLSIGQLVECSS
ncbi:hypothetical protein E1B28_008411 [Marasmius oreades]|uniref:Uncharacterized protein n=1 Tax=Marasmius oreades TaxID=181124 RepID=A0A9P7UU95_9AGAR|nr:uncharacterized protein E1B28_008411 [Marasmius oreades]KAG7092029.1 hypothetical protein E1B28_008411 [Marasmius oreades]